jgi:S-DNA-T family DNA segregation ATPase FtsK/SpoIIIE
VVALYDELHKLPKECRAVIEVGGGVSRIYDKDDTSGASRAFRPDIAFGDDPRELAVCLANTQLDSMTDAFVLPGVLSFLELHGVGKVEHLNPLTRWKESNPVLSLEAAVGVGSNGEQLRLDVHEKRHGPHGLIAGMTGSGKSEFIMTFILSLAVNYAPHEVAFVLIDYKGGGMANAFADLPHVAGTITNLDGAAINRSLVSIESELKRRQAIFNDAGEKTGTSTIDIYKYQSLYRDGTVTEPLPHLLIISDEFAELKSQQPEFMTQLVSAARIGRSLGVHLILATQKPSGVVDDQIWSNSRFRVCLKVQEKADSMEVIKRPDAAALAATGRFYLQVGFNELFDLGQSAWAGAPYYPADRVEKAYDDSIVVIDDIGRPLRQAKLDRRRSSSGKTTKQLDEVARYLAKVAADEGLATRPLWLEPIPELVYADELRAKYGGGEGTVLDPVVGEYDDPATQSQGLLTVPLTAAGNAVVYGSAGRGKTTFLTTLVFSLMQQHDPSQVHLYVLDFEAETLRAFRRAPHVGDVLCSYDREKIENLFTMLGDEIVRRRRLVADYGGDIASYVQQSGQEMASLVVIIHNYSAFLETYEDKEEIIQALTREGTRYGIYFVVTAASTSAIRFRILQNFKQLFVLQLNDATEYTSVLGSTGGMQPSPLHGRGIFKTDAVYEFQTAHPARTAASETAFIRECCVRMAEEWSGPVARRIPILPERVTIATLLDEATCADLKAVPIGVDARTLEVVEYDVRSHFVTLVLSQTGETGSFVTGLADAVSARCATRAVLLDAAEDVEEAPEATFLHVRGAAAANDAVAALFEEMVRRNNTTKNARVAGLEPPQFDAVVHLVPRLATLLESLTSTNRDRLTATLEKCDASLRASFVLADAESAMAGMVQQTWLRPHVTGSDGIWVGDGLSTQYTLQPAKMTSAMFEDIGPEFGYVLAKGKARRTKLLTTTAVAAVDGAVVG